ncbi:MAG: hypothetical protein Q8N05_16130 [Bacteroidota bacterium]|nr:hypothetical protein [Bacteroidota bacterium]
MDKILGSDKGLDCQTNPDGGVSCRVYKKKGQEKMATGTDVTIMASPENNCEPVLVGSSSINDEDEDHVQKIADRMKKACKKGLG